MFERTPAPREGMPDPHIDEAEFKKRFRSQFADPGFDDVSTELDTIAAVAWDAYDNKRKAPRTQKAGPGFDDPDYDLSDDWRAAKAAIDRARAEHEDRSLPPSILIINASSRTEHSCPGEMSKSWRLTELAKEAVEGDDCAVEILDLSRLTSEYGKNIHPCKACFSTAAPLCHWPCSCYPNYALGQTQDIMNDVYPLWVRAHGIMIITPVNWYHTTSPMKAMIDRLVCADGGNPDPTSTQGKDAKKAKAIELDGWSYPRHLEGRMFGLVVHGDVEGAENVRRSLSDWLCFMQLSPAGGQAEIDRYIGYWEPYATSHDALDKDEAIQDEVRNVARTLRQAVLDKRAGKFSNSGRGLTPPRQK